MAALIIAEHDNKKLNPNTRSMVTAASKLGDVEIAILGAGSSIKNVAEEASQISGVSKVHLMDSSVVEKRLAENVAPIVSDLASGYSHIIAPATTFGKNFMPRVAARLDIQQISEVTEIIDSKNFKRPIYAGNAIATVQSNEEKNLLTVRASTFDKASAEGGAAEIVEISTQVQDSGLSEYIKLEATESERPDLATADIVISGGRGMASGENFSLLEKVADKLGAAIGASRAAVDAGYVPNDYQIGQTGKIVAPDLYIAVGISGAIQHLAGMKDSKVIVAINKDENAPIFEVADYGLVADLFDVLPELESKL